MKAGGMDALNFAQGGSFVLAFQIGCFRFRGFLHDVSIDQGIGNAEKQARLSVTSMRRD
jgi:hypothetical protein